MIRVIGTQTAQYNNNYYNRPTVKYYNNNAVTKEEVKEDFGIILDREIRKLKIDVLI